MLRSPSAISAMPGVDSSNTSTIVPAANRPSFASTLIVLSTVSSRTWAESGSGPMIGGGVGRSVSFTCAVPTLPDSVRTS